MLHYSQDSGLAEKIINEVISNFKNRIEDNAPRNQNTKNIKWGLEWLTVILFTWHRQKQNLKTF